MMRIKQETRETISTEILLNEDDMMRVKYDILLHIRKISRIIYGIYSKHNIKSEEKLRREEGSALSEM